MDVKHIRVLCLASPRNTVPNNIDHIVCVGSHWRHIEWNSVLPRCQRICDTVWISEALIINWHTKQVANKFDFFQCNRNNKETTECEVFSSAELRWVRIRIRLRSV